MIAIHDCDNYNALSRLITLEYIQLIYEIYSNVNVFNR